MGKPVFLEPKPQCPFTEVEVAEIRRNWLFGEYSGDPEDSWAWEQLYNQDRLREWEQELREWWSRTPEGRHNLFTNEVDLAYDLVDEQISVVDAVRILDGTVERFADVIEASEQDAEYVRDVRARLVARLVFVA